MSVVFLNGREAAPALCCSRRTCSMCIHLALVRASALSVACCRVVDPRCRAKVRRGGGAVSSAAFSLLFPCSRWSRHALGNGSLAQLRRPPRRRGCRSRRRGARAEFDGDEKMASRRSIPRHAGRTFRRRRLPTRNEPVSSLLVFFSPCSSLPNVVCEPSRARQSDPRATTRPSAHYIRRLTMGETRVAVRAARSVRRDDS